MDCWRPQKERVAGNIRQRDDRMGATPYGPLLPLIKPAMSLLARLRHTDLPCERLLIGADRKSHFGAVRAAFDGEFNLSTQHSNLLAEMECGHEAAMADLLFCGPTV